ncbi:MAG: sigma-70 family RNA polymerase sigma factor, partial [Lachnospiraceae bacterium]|nr:sigma-70 family RNA polymerase sigma factor [Lachnospiraceae bacterium]
CRTMGREPRMEEVLEATGLSSEEMILAMESTREVESIHCSVYQADGSEVHLEDRLAEQRNEHELLENRMLVEHLMEELTPQERTLIRLRYFEEATQRQIADVLGTSQVQVSRMEKKILLRLRKTISQG